MVKPSSDRPFEGIITIHSEISPMASVEYGRTSEDEVTMTRMLDKVLRRSDAIDKESLCIVAGQHVWHLCLTIHCLAGIVAFKHTHRTEVEVINATEERFVPLAIHHTPFSVTFVFFPNSTTAHSVVDLSSLEQQLIARTMRVALNTQLEICVTHRTGVC